MAHPLPSLAPHPASPSRLRSDPRPPQDFQTQHNLNQFPLDWIRASSVCIIDEYETAKPILRLRVRVGCKS